MAAPAANTKNTQNSPDAEDTKAYGGRTRLKPADSGRLKREGGAQNLKDVVAKRKAYGAKGIGKLGAAGKASAKRASAARGAMQRRP